MIRYRWRIGPAVWTIPAHSRADAERILCLCLGVDVLPESARYLGCFPAEKLDK